MFKTSLRKSDFSDFQKLYLLLLLSVLQSTLLGELIYFHCVNLLPLLMAFCLLSILHAKLGTLYLRTLERSLF